MVVLGIVATYLILCLVVGIAAKGKSSDTATGYVAGDRNLNTLVMYFITGATIFSAFAFLGAPGWAYSRGAAAFYILAFGTLGFVPFYFLGPRAARLGRKYGFVTQGEMVSARFRNPWIAGVMALVSVLAFVPYLALQMKGAGLVLNAATGGALPSWQGALIVYAVVLVYVLASGVLGVGWTNTLQGVFMMILAWVLGLYIPYHLYGGVGAMFERIATERPELLKVPGLTSSGEPWKMSEFSTSILVSCIGFSVWPHLFMKAFTARSDATLRRTVMLYPTFQLFIVPLLIVGFAGVLFETAPPETDQILPHVLMNIDLPTVVVGLFCAGALAASMSSGDAIAHAAASALVCDGMVTALGKELDSARQRYWIRIFVVVVMAAAYIMAVWSEDTLVTLLLYAYGVVVQFAPPVIATLFVRRATGAGVLLGLVAGVAVNIYFLKFAEQRPFEIHAGLYGLAANLLVLTLVSLFLPGDSGDDAFLEAASGSGSDSPSSGPG